MFIISSYAFVTADSEAEETALEDAFEEGAILPDAGEEDEVLSITLDN